MQPYQPRITQALQLATFFALLSPAIGQPSPQYTIVGLGGECPTCQSAPVGLNNRGEVAVEVTRRLLPPPQVSLETRAYVWQKSVTHPLPLDHGHFAGLNDTGDVLLQRLDGRHNTAPIFLYIPAGRLAAIPNPDSALTLNGNTLLNNRGVFAAQNDETIDVFKGRQVRRISLRRLRQWPTTQIRSNLSYTIMVKSVSDSGSILVTYSQDLKGGYQSALIVGKTLKAIRPPAVLRGQYHRSFALQVNADDTVVRYFDLEPSHFQQKAFRWHSGVSQLLPMPKGAVSFTSRSP